MIPETVRLLITCPDARGIIAVVAGFIADHGGNILDADQHTDPQHGEFFMRVEIEPAGFRLTEHSFEQAWRPVAERYAMRWRISWGRHIKRAAILASREGHCLNDLLWRWRNGELRAEIPLVISNHQGLGEHVAAWGVPFHHVPVDDQERQVHEARLIDLLAGEQIDLIILARYMRILSKDFIDRYPERIINIHHSFLPAFAGPRPYHRAYERGVKIIGATSHYATEDLDEGPIIAQATLPIDHRDAVDDLIRKGRDLERVVLAEAVRLHLQDRILVSGNRTIVFD